MQRTLQLQKQRNLKVLPTSAKTGPPKSAGQAQGVGHQDKGSVLVSDGTIRSRQKEDYFMTARIFTICTVMLFIALPCFAKDHKHSNNNQSLGQWEKNTGNGRIVSGSDYHAGRNAVDIDGKIGDPVKPFRGGKVVGIDNKFDGNKQADPYGKSVIVKDNKGEMYRYSHLDQVNVKPGQKVSTKKNIGTIGNTGQTTALPGGDGSHLDFEQMGKNGKISPQYDVKSSKKKKKQK